MKDLIKYLKKIKNKDVLVIAHESPDGDAIGSSLGFGLLLKEIGARVIVLNKDEVPEKYKFLQESITIVNLKDLTSVQKDKKYIVFILDSAMIERIGFDLTRYFSEIDELVNIDHHVSNSFFGDRNYVYPDKGATSEIVGSLYLDLFSYIPKEAATAIFTGVMTDTGNLTYESTTSATVALVSILHQMGADFNKVRKQVYENDSYGQLEGLKTILTNLKLAYDGYIAYTYLSLEEAERYSLTAGDIENYVEYPRRVGSCEIAILFKEFEKDYIRISIRTKGEIDANRLAASFQGGGHKRASGFRIKSSMDEAVAFTIKRIEEGLRNNEWHD